MNKQQLVDMAEKAFEGVKEKRSNLWKTAEKLLVAQRTYEKAKATALTGGKIDGKNAEVREAQLREALVNEVYDFEVAQMEEREARYAYDIAQFDVDAVKTLLRIAELDL